MRQSRLTQRPRREGRLCHEREEGSAYGVRKPRPDARQPAPASPRLDQHGSAARRRRVPGSRRQPGDGVRRHRLCLPHQHQRRNLPQRSLPLAQGAVQPPGDQSRHSHARSRLLYERGFGERTPAGRGRAAGGDRRGHSLLALQRRVSAHHRLRRHRLLHHRAVPRSLAPSPELRHLARVGRRLRLLLHPPQGRAREPRRPGAREPLLRYRDVPLARELRTGQLRRWTGCLRPMARGAR